jgi:hypothetical protein
MRNKRSAGERRQGLLELEMKGRGRELGDPSLVRCRGSSPSCLRKVGGACSVGKTVGRCSKDKSEDSLGR